MQKSISTIILSSVLLSGSAIAGELGVTNSYGHSFRHGTGTTNINWSSNSQVTEQSASGAIKIERTSFDGSSNTNNGIGNGAQNPPGNSGGNGNAPTVPNLGDNFTDNAFAASASFGTRNYTESTTSSGTTNDTYSFGSTNFTHSVGTFSR